MAMFWANFKFYGTWWVGWFVIAILMGSPVSNAAASATGSLILPFGFLFLLMAWEKANGPRRGWGHDVDGQDGDW